MSDSGSRAESAAASDRNGSSPDPAPAPGSAASVANEDNASMPDHLMKPPEIGAHGLNVLWEHEDNKGEDDSSAGGHMPPVRDFDIVVVHGFHGPRRLPPWKNPGSGDSGWIQSLGRWSGRRVMCFGYNALDMLSGERTWRSIRRTSIRLLDELKKKRASPEQRRPIMFVTHDIGGIIVKDALTHAGLYPALYADIFDYTRLLVFYGCPHQSVDRVDMEDRLSQFLLGNFNSITPRLQGTLASVKGLATAVLDINHLFIDSKHVYRSHVISIYNGSDDSQIHKVFDQYSGTLRVPFEKRIAGGVSQEKDMESIEPHLVKMHAQLYPDETTIAAERTLLSIARPTAALTTADVDDHPFCWLGENETYTSWSQQHVPQVLYLHGSSGVRQAAEFAFYDLDKTVRHQQDINEIVLFFTFDRHDIRADTTEDMLTTFLAQIICHNPSLREVVHNQFERLAIDRSWSDYDLLAWFEHYRVRGQVTGVSCVINCFEECEEESRKAFLKLVTRLSQTHERPWRIIVTSRERGVLSEELKGWPSIDLDRATSSSKEADGPDSASLWMTSAQRLFRRRPELKENQQVQAELLKMAPLDPAIRDLALAQVSRRSQWPHKETVEAILGDLAELSISGVVDMVVAAIPEQDRALALRALGWLVCAPRPLSVWELGMALFLGSEGDDGQSATPGYGYVELMIPKITEWFAGIVSLEVHELRLTGPHFRQIIKDKADGMPTWDGQFVETINKDIVETCLNFLLRPQVRKSLEDVYGKGGEKSSVMDLPSMVDCCNFCSYAVLYWLDHLQQIPSAANLSDVLNQFITSESVSVWSKAYWALSNPITRSQGFFPSIYPILAGRGLGDLAEPFRAKGEDISPDLVEACRNGLPHVVSSLLSRTQHSEMALQEALVAAGSKGDEEVWKLVIQHTRNHHENFTWPASLLSRASWLGLTDIVAELLEVGCDPNPEDPPQGNTPLHLAARNGHRDVVKTLLDHKADAKRIGQVGRTVLHLAAVVGHAHIIDLLIKESDVDVNARDINRLTAVYLASLWGHFKAVETLVKLGADLNMGDGEPGQRQWCPLVVAIDEGHVLGSKALLEGGADPNCLGWLGTPLRYAVFLGHLSIARMLIEHKADIHHEAIYPPILMFAINTPQIKTVEARIEMARLLVDKGAKLDVVDEDGETPLCQAISVCESTDAIPLVSYLLGRGVDINGRSGPDKWTALHLAVTKGNAELVKVLIEKAADVNPPVTEQNLATETFTPVHVAVSKPDILRLLLANKAAVAGHGDKIPPVLVEAVVQNNLESIQLLLDHGAPLEEHNNASYDGHTALLRAAYFGHGEALRLLADAGANLHATDGLGRTILHLALDSKDALPACLEYRPPLDVQDVDGDTPLHTYWSGTPLGHYKLLVRAGARLDMQNKEGFTPLSKAIQSGEFEVAEYLLSKSSSEVVNSVSDMHGSALHIACGCVNLELVKKLVERKADVNLAVSSLLGTPLQAAILYLNSANGPRRGPPNTDNIAAVVDVLLDAGADVSAVGGPFGTAVAATALRGTPAMLTKIMEKGGRQDVPDAMGRLPIQLAGLNQHGRDNFDVLLESDGDVLAKDKAGRTALHWAAQGGHVDIVRRILRKTGDGVVDQADIDGWTPLCWALRRPGAFFYTRSMDDQVEVVQKLIQHGAKVDCRLPGRLKCPVDIARYHSADGRILALLGAGHKGNEPEAEGAVDNAEAGDEEEVKEPKRLKSHRMRYGYHAHCAYCLTTIQGFRYECETCADVSFCYKCYESRTALHPAHDTFKQFGPEFEIFDDDGSTIGSRVEGETGSATSEAGDEEEGDESEEYSEELAEEGEDDDDDDESDDDDD